jgi:hypothetical protein
MARQSRKLTGGHLLPLEDFRKPKLFQQQLAVAPLCAVRVGLAEEKRDGLWGYIPSRRLILEKVVFLLFLSFLFTAFLINHTHVSREGDPIKGACGSDTALFSPARQPFWPIAFLLVRR